MITNFEEITFDLTKEEKKLIPVIKSKFKKHSVNNPIKTNEMLSYILKTEKVKLHGPRLRKICNYLRCNGFTLIATSKGYFYTKNKNIIAKQIKSLLERSDAIANSAHGLYQSL